MHLIAHISCSTMPMAKRDGHFSFGLLNSLLTDGVSVGNHHVHGPALSMFQLQVVSKLQAIWLRSSANTPTNHCHPASHAHHIDTMDAAKLRAAQRIWFELKSNGGGMNQPHGKRLRQSCTCHTDTSSCSLQQAGLFLQTRTQMMPAS